MSLLEGCIRPIRKCCFKVTTLIGQLWVAWPWQATASSGSIDVSCHSYKLSKFFLERYSASFLKLIGYALEIACELHSISHWTGIMTKLRNEGECKKAMKHEPSAPQMTLFNGFLWPLNRTGQAKSIWNGGYDVTSAERKVVISVIFMHKNLFAAARCSDRVIPSWYRTNWKNTLFISSVFSVSMQFSGGWQTTTKLWRQESWFLSQWI